MDERRRVIEEVNNDRRYTIDAAIVRIMKSHKVLGHQQLVMECVEQLSRMFKVSLSLHIYIIPSFCMICLYMKNAKLWPWKLFLTNLVRVQPQSLFPILKELNKILFNYNLCETFVMSRMSHQLLKREP